MGVANLLLIAIFLPLLGVGLLWVVAPLGQTTVKWTALGITLATLIVAGRVVSPCGYW